MTGKAQVGMRVGTTRGTGVITSTEINARMVRIWWVALDSGETVPVTLDQIKETR